MAVRIRKDGSIVCAAMFPKEEGDMYIDDGLHYYLSVEQELLITDDNHLKHGLWWWINKEPSRLTS